VVTAFAWLAATRHPITALAVINWPVEPAEVTAAEAVPKKTSPSTNSRLRP